MIFVLSTAILFIGLSIYFYFRAEGLQRTLNNTKNEFVSTKKENKHYVDSMAIIAKRNEDFAKNRLQTLKEKEVLDQETIDVITPLINNYAVIFVECLKGNGRLQPIAKKCYESYDDKGYKNLVVYVSQQEASIKRMWSSNSLSGYISLIEALLLSNKNKNT